MKQIIFLYWMNRVQVYTLVIEHNLDIISQADWIVDIGPLAGDKGGELVFSGTVSGLLSAEKSLTGYYLKKYLEL